MRYGLGLAASRPNGGTAVNRPPLKPCAINFFKNMIERFGDIPDWIVPPHLVQVTDITDVVALSVFINVIIEHFLAGDTLDESEGLEDRTAISSTAA